MVLLAIRVLISLQQEEMAALVLVTTKLLRNKPHIRERREKRGNTYVPRLPRPNQYTTIFEMYVPIRVNIYIILVSCSVN
jgi:hypothetical protein